LVWQHALLAHVRAPRQAPSAPPSPAARAQVSLPTQYNGKNQSPVGALSGTLARLQANRPLRELREIAKGVTKQLPDAIQARARRPRARMACAGRVG